MMIMRGKRFIIRYAIGEFIELLVFEVFVCWSLLNFDLKARWFPIEGMVCLVVEKMWENLDPLCM